MLVAVLVDRIAVDEFQREVRRAARTHPAVEQARNARVVERRENLSLGAEALVVDLRVEPRAQQLERNTLLERAIGTLGQEDSRHAAAPDLLYDPVRTDPLAFELLSGDARFGHQRGGRFSRRGLEERSRGGVLRQQPGCFPAKRRVPVARFVEDARPLGWIALEGRVDDAL